MVQRPAAAGQRPTASALPRPPWLSTHLNDHIGQHPRDIAGAPLAAELVGHKAAEVGHRALARHAGLPGGGGGGGPAAAPPAGPGGLPTASRCRPAAARAACASSGEHLAQACGLAC